MSRHLLSEKSGCSPVSCQESCPVSLSALPADKRSNVDISDTPKSVNKGIRNIVVAPQLAHSITLDKSTK